MSDENKPAEETVDPVTGEKIVPQLTPEELAARTDAGPSRRQVLRQKADQLGITYSPNIGDDTLKERIDEHIAALEGNGDEPADPNAPDPSVEPVVATAPVQPAQPQPAVQPAAQAPVQPQAPAPQPQPQVQTLTPRKPGVSASTHMSRPSGMPSDDEIMAMSQDDIAALRPDMRKQVIRHRQKKECMRMIRCQIYNNNPAKNELKGEILSVGNKYLGTVRKFIPFGEATENGYHVPKILVDMLRAKRYQRVRSVKNPDGTERVETILAPEFTINELPPLTQDQLDELAAMQVARNASVGFVGA